MSDSAETVRPVTGRRVLFWLVLSFGVIVAVNLVMVVLSIETFTGETEPKSYANGLDFNHRLERVAAQHARGWNVTADVKPTGGQHVNISVRYLDRDGAPLHGLDVEAQFVRPTNEGIDFSAPLAEQGDGVYSATASLPLPGQWHVRLSAVERDQPPYLLDYTVIAK